MSETVLQDTLEKLNKFKKNSDWFESHYDELKREYKNQYVVINVEIDSTGPIEHDIDYKALINRMRGKYDDLGSFVIERVYDHVPTDVF